MAAKPKPPKRGVDKPFRGALNRALEANPHLMDEMLASMIRAASRGSFAHQKELIDRSDGRVPYKVGGDEELDPVKIIVTGVPRPGRD